MKTIKINDKTEINLERLIATRMLINANSGGGKSWALRRILEQSHGQVQQIVIDLEGEFASLREKYDYLLVGKEGEIPVHIRTAELLAKRLLELNVSAIIDLSELRQHERITFVKRFIDSLVNSPKKLWHPLLVVVDEAHQFCPEKGKAESGSSVIDLMTRGRKRGFAGILATQRISKLNKDAIAEANNYMIGRAFLDIDQKRASETLGFTTKQDTRSLRDLKAGEFYMVGSAFSNKGIEKIKVGNVETTHQDRTRGINLEKPIETPENIKKLLKDVADLPKEAEEEIKTKQEFKKKIKELKTKVTILEKSKPKPIADERMLNKAEEKGYRDGMNHSSRQMRELEIQKRFLETKIEQISKILGKQIALRMVEEKKPKIFKIEKEPVRKSYSKVSDVSYTSNGKLRAGAMKMLNWIAGAYPEPLTKMRIATLSGFSVKGGTFNTYLSELKREGWIEGSNEFVVTKEGLHNAEPQEIPSGEELLRLWKKKFRAGAGKILDYLYRIYPEEIPREDLGNETGFEPSGGTFNTYLSELRRNGLIEIDNGNVRISEEFF